MRVLTTGTTGQDIFGGIHTQIEEHIRNSPNSEFHIIDPNKEKKYEAGEDRAVLKLDTPSLIESDDLLSVLNESQTVPDFSERVEPLVNEYQNAIQDVDPGIVLVAGTSLTSFLLYKAARREKALGTTVICYGGVLEKEITDYTGEPREILRRIARTFTEPEALEQATYVFPSVHCKGTVEEMHEVQIESAHIIPNGISREFIESGEERNPPQNLSYGYVGRLHHVKNLPFFLNINDNTEEKAKLKVITDLNAVFRRKRGKLLLEKLTRGEAFYHAPRPPTELDKFYRTAVSAIVIPSFFETFCNVAPEAAVCGTPALLSDRAGAKEVYQRHGLEGLVFNITDMDSFKEAQRVARGMDYRIPPEVSRSIGSELSWKKVIAKYDEVFESVRN